MFRVTLCMLMFIFLYFILDTPRHLYFLHTLTWLLNMFGIFFILAAHEHYSIDVFVAFYISSRLFLYYHTLANNQVRSTHCFFIHERCALIFFLSSAFVSGTNVTRFKSNTNMVPNV